MKAPEGIAGNFVLYALGFSSVAFNGYARTRRSEDVQAIGGADLMDAEEMSAITYYDDAHSDYEPRFVTLGISDKGRVLVVCHTLIGETIRLITARKATRHETNFYEKENKKTRRGR